jgi:hypothetical protein
MKNYGILFLIGISILIACKKKGDTGPAGPDGPTGPAGSSGTNASGYVHYVGQKFGGGIVFHVYKDSLGVEHGLIASLNDQSAGCKWGLGWVDIPNCESTWNGAANTATILAAGSLSTDAANICDVYVNGTFTDWYLPALHELNKLDQNLYEVNRVLSTDNDPLTTEVTFGSNDYYWSSTEVNTTTAAGFQFAAAIAPKGNIMKVRVVRSF